MQPQSPAAAATIWHRSSLLAFFMPSPTGSKNALTLWELGDVLQVIHRHAEDGALLSPLVLGRELQEARGKAISPDDLFSVLTYWGWEKTETMDPVALSEETVNAVLTLGGDDEAEEVSAMRDLCFLWRPIKSSDPHRMNPSERRRHLVREQGRMDFMAKLFTMEAFRQQKSAGMDLGAILDSLSRSMACAIRDETNRASRFGARDKLSMAADVFSTCVRMDA